MATLEGATTTIDVFYKTSNPCYLNKLCFIASASVTEPILFITQYKMCLQAFLNTATGFLETSNRFSVLLLTFSSTNF